MMGESHSFSRVVVGRLGFLSSYDGEHRGLSCCLREVQSPFGVCEGSSGIALESQQEIRPQFALKGES